MGYYSYGSHTPNYPQLVQTPTWYFSQPVSLRGNRPGNTLFGLLNRENW